MEAAPEVVEETAPEDAEEAACIIIKSLAGTEVLNFRPVPPNVAALKQLIAESGYMPVAVQKLLREDGFDVCSADEPLEAVNQAMILVQDETPLWYWDLENNPSKAELDIEGPILKCSKLRTDYTNVVTQEPVASGLHYFEFHLQHYGDEQWCGLTPDKSMAGPEYEKAVPSKTGWYYYTGRRTGALQALGHHLKEFEYVERSGDTIGMLVDCDNGAAAFDLNGKIQGACEIPKKTPLWVLTHVDTPGDHVELFKPSLQDAPPANLEALKGALLDVSQGTKMLRSY